MSSFRAYDAAKYLADADTDEVLEAIRQANNLDGPKTLIVSILAAARDEKQFATLLENVKQQMRRGKHVKEKRKSKPKAKAEPGTAYRPFRLRRDAE